VPGDQRLYSAGRYAMPDVRGRLFPRRQDERVVLSEPRPLAVLRSGLRLRGRRDGRRTVAGPHQTVFLPKGTFRRACAYYARHRSRTSSPQSRFPSEIRIVSKNVRSPAIPPGKQRSILNALSSLLTSGTTTKLTAVNGVRQRFDSLGHSARRVIHRYQLKARVAVQYKQ